MTLQSIFERTRPPGTEWDILSDEGGKIRQRGRVQSFSDFERGYDGFAALYSAGMQRMPISLSTEIAAVHGDTSLKLSTAEKAYESTTDATNGADADSTLTASAYKRLMSFRETGLISISCYIALRHGGANDTQPVTRSIGIGLDMQKQDNTSRAFPRIFYRSYFLPDGSGTSRLDVQGNSGLLAVTGSTNAGLPSNENKGNFAYLRLTFDRDANNGQGGYYEAQINSKVYDLTTLIASGERGAQTPQVTTNRPLTDYRGGNNAGLFVQRNTDSGTASQFPAVGFFDAVCVTMGDVKA